MPVTLPPISRRNFLKVSAAAGAGILLGPELLPGRQTTVDPDRLALLSDVHIAADVLGHERGVVMYDHLQRVRDELLALDASPAAILINGDCAYHTGRPADYQTLLGLLLPLRERGLALHLSMGNHDSRENLWRSIPASERHVPALPNRQIEVLKLARANLFLLDSLNATNSTPGILGPKQLAWLASALDAERDKPAIVFVHHNPDSRPHPSGLLDTKPLLDVLLSRTNVKALFYGHTHEWSIDQRQSLHCINLPAVAYVFKPGQPSGWVDAHLTEDGMSLQLLCLDKSHPNHGQKVELKWRA